MATKPEITNELNLIGVGTIVEGKVKTPGNIRVDGRIVGELTASQNVAVGASGSIEGTVQAKGVTIAGKVKGIIVAQEKLVFESKASVQGDIRAAKLVIDEGAIFDGKCMMSDAKAMPNVVELKSEMQRAQER